MLNYAIVTLYLKNLKVPLIVSNLTCEYRTNPLGIDVLQPRLSWQLESDRRGTSPDCLSHPCGCVGELPSLSDSVLWDSGKVSSDQSIHVTYGVRACIRSTPVLEGLGLG